MPVEEMTFVSFPKILSRLTNDEFGIVNEISPAYTNGEENNVNIRQLSYNENGDFEKHEQCYKPANVVALHHNVHGSYWRHEPGLEMIGVELVTGTHFLWIKI